jgi:hypothetical protein
VRSAVRRAALASRPVRQIFSVRFFAAVGVVAALLFGLVTVFAAGRAIDDGEGGAAQAAPDARRIDLIDLVAGSSNPAWSVDPASGEASGDTVLTIDPSRSVTIVSGTAGSDHCGRVIEPGACAVVLDLLGDGVVWFALIPAGTGGEVPVPAVDTLDDGVATLVNGWQLPHAPAYDRRCGDEQFESYRQFKQVFGENFTTIYDLAERSLTAVVCRQRVRYAPAASPGPFS